MVKRHIDQMTHNFRARNERIETGASAQSQKREECQHWEVNKRILSVESKWAVLKRRLLKGQPRKEPWTTSTIVFSCSKGADTDWRKKALDRKSPQERESFWKEWPKKSANIVLKESVRIRRVIILHPPVCQNYKTESGQMGSVQEETLVGSAAEGTVDNKHNRLLLLQRRRHRLTEKKPSTGKVPRRESPSGRNGQKRVQKLFWRKVYESAV